ncbi:MAG: elongation factor Ts [Bacteroidetes bacterium CG18_big_fil_WC_8_21_14_2_50_41_14]|nr:MAG: elongation factor Ts [Bacteroidetes bacterium CG18_big_fil_WC_8_21_14_2_50_41_14]PJB60050.1 MAG: elongation factor Ts [Bacteroidetes bacterium CG_4_9_14_3_um_filter_41_19]
MNITAQQVNELRKVTGAGMMDCKKALIEAEGNMENAIDVLRKKGQKVAANRADRSASEGVVLAKTSADGKFTGIVMINCETDFVAKNADFVEYVQSVLDVAVENKAKNAEELSAMSLNGRTVGETIVDKTGVIGEKIEIGKYAFVTGESTYAYIHPGNRIATIVAFNKAGQQLAQAGKDVAMQAAAMSPIALDKGDITQDVIDREIEIGKDQARQEGKAEEMLEKIALGKLNKFYKENTLVNQTFIKDAKKSVAEYLTDTEKGLTVTDFKRFALGA